ncbi:hypothetical protein S40285_09199 [Stachybotrys chlorohalonatus IBT 40285]|uniref:protein-ribulosamine 3-kinase n=1 Tax=Stachybotrys chlorohalonatus (strain IBT 40285) TaxID=1283841 RepID=A0A084QRU1_STAC4|nr:hypothetical protein S40285_09199 [Stachybotrys chlorohalonata IBT 40285]
MANQTSERVQGIEGNFPVPAAVLAVLPEGAKVVAGERAGTSAWTKTAKVTVELADGSTKRYFLKCATGPTSRAMTEGEWHSADAIDSTVPGLVPKPAGWGEYYSEGEKYYFYLADFHDMDLSAAPEPAEFAALIAKLHTKGTSPNGMFGYAVPTVIGKMERTVTWEANWAASFTHLLEDAIRYDNQTNGLWPAYDAACEQLIKAVIPRLLGVLQSEGRSITPALVHGDLWENNVGVDMDSGDIVVFDPGCTYSHNEFEFGTWRCTWAFHFNSPTYMRHYQRHIEPSEPAEEWEDRNRLYSIHPYLIDSAGHPGSLSRKIAYNDILYLCEKYGPLEELEKYDPDGDVVLTGGYVPFVIEQMA